MRVTILALGLALGSSLLCACQGARLPAANAGRAPVGTTAPTRASPPPPRRSTRYPEARPNSHAQRLAQPFVTAPNEVDSNPYRPPLHDAALAEVERAIVLRQRARQPRPVTPSCSASMRARAMPLPDKNGDQERGGFNLGRLFSAIEQLIKHGRIR